MGIEELANALKGEAATEGEQLLADAARKAEEILRETGERLARLNDEAARIEAKCVAVEAALSEGTRKIVARKRRAAAEHAYLQAVREKCRLLFRDFMRTPAYAPFAAEQLRLATAELGAVEKVAADPVTAAALKGALPPGAAIEEQAGVADGFIAYGSGGRAFVYSTFDTRYDKAWRQNAAAYVKAIAGAATDGI